MHAGERTPRIQPAAKRYRAVWTHDAGEKKKKNTHTNKKFNLFYRLGTDRMLAAVEAVFTALWWQVGAQLQAELFKPNALI